MPRGGGIPPVLCYDGWSVSMCAASVQLPLLTSDMLPLTSSKCYTVSLQQSVVPLRQWSLLRTTAVMPYSVSCRIRYRLSVSSS